jgi:hypothetical protein
VAWAGFVFGGELEVGTVGTVGWGDGGWGDEFVVGGVVFAYWEGELRDGGGEGGRGEGGAGGDGGGG